MTCASGDDFQPTPCPHDTHDNTQHNMFILFLAILFANVNIKHMFTRTDLDGGHF